MKNIFTARRLCLAMVLVVLATMLFLVAATGADAGTNATPEGYSAADIAAMNAIIRDHPELGSKITPWETGENPPAEWAEVVTWGDESKPLRIVGLDLCLTSRHDFNYGMTGTLNTSGLPELIDLDCGFNYLTGLDVSGNTKLQRLDCSGNNSAAFKASASDIKSDSGISSLDLSKNTELTNLWCATNRLTALDISANTKLIYLECNRNGITDLNLEKNTELTNLICDDNQISELDVSKNAVLKSLLCGRNLLTKLDVTKNAELNSLYCDDNLLVSLDVTKNSKLYSLGVGNNLLTKLDITQNTELDSLLCGSNLLTELNVEANPKLLTVSCYNNQLISLDVTKNAQLVSLNCGDNQLRELDLSNNSNLFHLDCRNNKISSLELKNKLFLFNLDCSNNTLTGLDVTNCEALARLICNYNYMKSVSDVIGLESFGEIEYSFEPQNEIWDEPFTDVGFGDWFYDYVGYVYTNGLMEGTSATKFSPNSTLTRAMVWAILARLEGVEVTGENWIQKVKEFVIPNGISDGTDPTGFATRRELATMLYRYAGIGEDGWNGEAMEWAQNEYIINDGRPDDTATRAECAAIIQRFCAIES
ncbi:MAG: S-layer homology domain-containing protein [Oscillospiraceae bacterium]|jgi:hypothetical protein|nr:S-layer homology domain-containing protein [Oscillospiraceae bacterium]